MEIRRYVKKISGPLLDRMDIYVHVPSLEYEDIVLVRKHRGILCSDTPKSTTSTRYTVQSVSIV